MRVKGLYLNFALLVEGFLEGTEEKLVTFSCFKLFLVTRILRLLV